MTELNLIETEALGIIQIRFDVSGKWHRTTLNPHTDVDAQFVMVNEHLAQLGYAPVSAEIVDGIKSYAAAQWTPEVVAAFEASLL
jgi:hypothetical protein